MGTRRLVLASCDRVEAQASTPFQNGRPAPSRVERDDACDGADDVLSSAGEEHIVGVVLVGVVKGGWNLGRK